MSTEHDFAMAAGHAKVAPHPERFDDLPARSTTRVEWLDRRTARRHHHADAATTD